jgi:hypothetical protein
MKIVEGLAQRAIFRSAMVIGAAIVVLTTATAASPRQGTRVSTPEGPGSVFGAPHLPAGFTKTFTSRCVAAGQDFETLTVRQDGAVLFADIAAPPMNLLGPELVRDLVSLIQRAETNRALPARALDDFVRSLAHRIAGLPAGGRVMVKERVNALAPPDDFRRDSDLFGQDVRDPEAQKRIRGAIKQGSQTQEAEMALGQLPGDLSDR